MTNFALQFESDPKILSNFILLYGKKRAYWNLRFLGATRYQALRAIFFAG